MSATRTCRFERSGWGSLELEIAESTRGFFHTIDPEAIPFSTKGLESTDPEQQPFFFYEWQKFQYSYLIEMASEFRAPFTLRINNRTVSTSKERGNHHLITGQFTFQDEVGETVIELRDQTGRLIFQLCTEVFPQKMDYKSDYKAMMADITSIIHNLAVDTLKSTFRKSKARITGSPTDHEWWNILDALFDQFILQLGVIRRQPKHEIRKTEHVLPIEKIKTASKKNVDWFRKNARYSNDREKGVRIATETYASHALSSKKYVTYDTYENRFIAWAIREIIEQLRRYKKHMESVSGAGDYTALIQRMQFYQSRLQGILHESPFNEAGVFEKRVHFSTSLTRGAGYRDFMYIYLLLKRGLEIVDNDLFRIESKNISTLYEYWCFLKLVQLLTEQHGSELDFQDLVRVKSNKFSVKLEKGAASKVIFRNTLSEIVTTIYFNREFTRNDSKVFTYNQRPDYVVSFKKAGFKQPFWYLFDAKYRFEDVAEREHNRYNVPQDAIGQLHRYRDAILHTDPTESTYQRAIKNLGGIILYPYPLSEREFENNVFYRSIAQVNIGALPFLPSKSGLTRDFLNRLIHHTSPETHFEQFIGMDDSEYTTQRNRWKETVAIGVIPKQDHAARLQFIEATAIYHVPFVKNTHSRIYGTKQWLVCQSGSTQATLYDVIGWEILSDQALRKLGTTWEHRATSYIAFRVKPVRQLTTPEKLSPLRYRYATAEGLNRYLRDPETDQQAFYLTQPDAARLYTSLRQQDLPFRISWADDNNDPSLIYFTVWDVVIHSSDQYPELHYRLDDKIVSLQAVLDLFN